MEKILLPSLRWWLCFESHVSMQHIYGIALLILACGALIGIILWLERIVTKAENKLKNLKTMEEKKNCIEHAENPKMYTEAELVSFGNYLLEQVRSWKRVEEIEDPKLLHVVGDWDIANWRESMK